MTYRSCVVLVLAICPVIVAAQSQTYLYGRAVFPVGKVSSVGTGPNPIAVGDFDGDGILDLVVANSNDNTVSVLLGEPNGTFVTQVSHVSGIGTV